MVVFVIVFLVVFVFVFVVIFIVVIVFVVVVVIIIIIVICPSLERGYTTWTYLEGVWHKQTNAQIDIKTYRLKQNQQQPAKTPPFQ